MTIGGSSAVLVVHYHDYFNNLEKHCINIIIRLHSYLIVYMFMLITVHDIYDEHKHT